MHNLEQDYIETRNLSECAGALFRDTNAPLLFVGFSAQELSCVCANGIR